MTTDDLYEAQAGPVPAEPNPDDLSREVYCILGIPIDEIGMGDVLLRIRAATEGKTPFLYSTPNLNFLVNSLSDTSFKESLLQSDLCPADGMPIVWIARLLGVPIKRRIAGADVFDALIADESHAKPLKVYLFGGPEGVAAAASRVLNARSSGLYCVGSFYPGFGSVEEMSQNGIIENINKSGADLLVVSLSATKGQSWLLHNHARLKVAVRVHLGAVMNFQAGTVKRAPAFARNAGLEWLWRIYEEPNLWSRYWGDGQVLLRLLLTRVLPLAVLSWWLRQTLRRQKLTVTRSEDERTVVVGLFGPATTPYVGKAIAAFTSTMAAKKQIVIDFSNTPIIDARFCGLLLMLNKKLRSVGATLIVQGLSPRLERLFRLHGLGFLLPSGALA